MSKVKGILLAGGSGTRLYPLTKITSKQLLPIYDKPMIYYPLSTLMLFDIREILIISTPVDLPNIEKLLGDGSKFGLKLSYKVQEKPNGIAEAFKLGADFIGNDPVCLILGDNVFYLGEQFNIIHEKVLNRSTFNATIFAYHVSEPGRFGVVEFDKLGKVISIEEKPQTPKSNYVSVGLYFYPPDVVEKVKTLVPSARGEYEITDLNNLYLKEQRLSVLPMGRGAFWQDAGTPDSLFEVTSFVQVIEKRQGLKIACIEEIAYKKGFIDDEQMMSIINSINKNVAYRDYLIKVYEEKHELY